MRIALVHRRFTTHGGTERYLVGLTVSTSSWNSYCRIRKERFGLGRPVGVGSKP
jgi:hypothetical protein